MNLSETVDRAVTEAVKMAQGNFDEAGLQLEILVRRDPLLGEALARWEAREPRLER